MSLVTFASWGPSPPQQLQFETPGGLLEAGFWAVLILLFIVNALSKAECFVLRQEGEGSVGKYPRQRKGTRKNSQVVSGLWEV